MYQVLEQKAHENSKNLDQDSPVLAGTQVATVQGGVDNCGSIDFPSLYIRLDDPDIFNFIMAILLKTLDLLINARSL